MLQRGQRIGIIKLGSTTELYLPQEFKPRVTVQKGQKVAGGVTVLAHLSGRTSADDLPNDIPTAAIANSEQAET